MLDFIDGCSDTNRDQTTTLKILNTHAAMLDFGSHTVPHWKMLNSGKLAYLKKLKGVRSQTPQVRIEHLQN